MKTSLKIRLPWIASTWAIGLLSTLAYAESNLNEARAPKLRKPIPDHYIVTLKANSRSDDVIKLHGVSAHFKYKHSLNGFAAKLSQRTVEQLKSDSRVASIEQDLEVYALGQAAPNGIKRIGALANPIAKIDGADERVSIDVAIIDTGIDYTHPDLNVVQHVNFSTSVSDGMDGQGHGTHVAGIVGALDNDLGVVGVAPGARLWAVKVLDDSGSGSTSAIIAGIDYVTQNAASISVANMSLGGMGTSPALQTAIQNSVAKGVVYVVAAGNSSSDVLGANGVIGDWDDFFPASFPEVLSVSAVSDTDGLPGGLGSATNYGPDDALATFSNHSLINTPLNPISSPGAKIDLAAPGVNIYSTYKGGAYATMSGTSMASPHVAGSVALFIAQNGRAKDAAGVARIRQALIDVADYSVKTSVGLFEYNYEGLVNVASLSNIASKYGPPVNHVAAIQITSPLAGASFAVGQSVSFSAFAIDAEEGDKSSSIRWFATNQSKTSSGTTLRSNGASLSFAPLCGTKNFVTATYKDSLGIMGVSVPYIIDFPDTTPPTAPTNLVATSVDSTKVVLNWGAASDDCYVTYGMIRKTSTSSLSAGLGENVTSYTDTSMTPGVTYSYYIVAMDRSGNSTKSNTITVTVPMTSDLSPPSVPSNLAISVIDPLRVSLKWSPSTDNIGVRAYLVLRDGAQIASVNSPSTSLVDSNVIPGSSYVYQVRAVDSAGNMSLASNPQSVVMPAADGIAPSIPSNVSASAPDSSRVNVNWSASSDNYSVVKYDVYRNNLKIGSVAAPSTSFADASVSANAAYSYSVKALDYANNESGMSSAASVTVPPPPLVISSISAAPTGNSALITWKTNAPSSGQVLYGLSSGNLSQSTAFGPNTMNGSVTLSGLSRHTTIYYQIKVVDSLGRTSFSAIGRFRTLNR